ncbi:MAG: DUF3822 family protein [Saprospiraceae bacterium]|nr:DUF3822 family protein [Saprospiraceae bacterium]
MEQQLFTWNNAVPLTPDVAARAELRVVMGIDALSVLVTDDEGRVLQVESVGFEPSGNNFNLVESDLRQVFQRLGTNGLNHSFRQRHLALFHPAVTLVPRRLFQPDALEVYFRLLLPEGHYNYGFDALPELDCYLVYAVEPAALQIYRQFFPGHPVQHLATALLRSWRPATVRMEHSVWVNVRRHHIQVMVFDRQNLQFYNSFSCENAADAAYFTLLAFEQFKLDPAQVPLHLAGLVDEHDELYQKLYQFVQDVRFTTLPPGFFLGAGATFPGHKAADVFSLI